MFQLLPPHPAFKAYLPAPASSMKITTHLRDGSACACDERHIPVFADNCTLFSADPAETNGDRPEAATTGKVQCGVSEHSCLNRVCVWLFVVSLIIFTAFISVPIRSLRVSIILKVLWANVVLHSHLSSRD
jgi:hypothetical protein